MAQAGDTFQLHDGEKVTVVTPSADSGGELLEVSAEWTPASHKPLVHSHPKQDEHFEILEGELTVKLDGERHVLKAGDSFDVPRGTKHSMWNSGSVPTRATWQVRPALGTEDFWANVHSQRAAGHTGKGGMINMPAAAVVLSEFPDEFEPEIPGAVRKPAFAVLRVWARLRGYPQVKRDASAPAAAATA
ncbi:MAG TPA: cupin domain-containing protein [Candidatus Dormibacteraeota bacterium]|nr:cupin domain-containing protein [Candidatus Dormibacteraeota bacterium]